MYISANAILIDSIHLTFAKFPSLIISLVARSISLPIECILCLLFGIRLRPSITFRENDIYRSDAGSVTRPDCIDDEDSLEIPHSQLNIGRNIGKGAFGSVYFAYAENFRGEKRVEMAVKKLRSMRSFQVFFSISLDVLCNFSNIFGNFVVYFRCNLMKFRASSHTQKTSK